MSLLNLFNVEITSKLSNKFPRDQIHKSVGKTETTADQLLTIFFIPVKFKLGNGRSSESECKIK